MLEDFKKNWEIKKNWQLLFPVIGTLGLAYTSYKIAGLLPEQWNLILKILCGIGSFLLLLKFILFLFEKLKNKWVLEYRWEMIRVFIVFAVTGSSSMFVGRPIIKFIGITKENLNPFVYWALFIIIGLIFYQILLVTFGWLFGQFKFFWKFEKKMLRRFGLGSLLDK